jgi:hypothetical protein
MHHISAVRRSRQRTIKRHRISLRLKKKKVYPQPEKKTMSRSFLLTISDDKTAQTPQISNCTDRFIE